MEKRFRNRSEAGRILAAELSEYAQQPRVIVLGLPRGGVPVAYEVAKALGAPLDVFIVRKLGLPGHEELAMGALASGGIRILNSSVVRAFGVNSDTIERAVVREQQRIEEQERLFRGDRPFPILAGHTVILVDDGLATGSSMRAAVAALRQHRPERVVVAVPVAATETCEAFKAEVDAVVCARLPEPFLAVGMWYRDFSQTSDDEVRHFLSRAAQEQPALSH